eukprot:EST48262.1 hypothetical protein SS50377_11603 [Spironucleus salmonicida]
MLKLNPSPAELNDIFIELLQTSQSHQIDYKIFRQMRLSPPGTFLYQTIINICAEYIKFNCAYIHRGFITEDAIETALERENCSENFIDSVKAQMLKLVFNEQFKILGFKELFCFMRSLVPNQWRQWICDCLFQEYDPDAICQQLIERGFDERAVRGTVKILMENGYVSALPEFVDKCPLNVTHLYV